MKRVLSLILAVVLVFGLSVTGFAADKISGVDDAFTSKDMTDLSVSPGKKYEFPLEVSMFNWSGSTPNTNTAITSSMLSSAKVDVKVNYKGKSKNYIEEISIKYKKYSNKGSSKSAYVYVEFKDNLVTGTEGLDFDFTVTLTYKGKSVSASGVQFEGKIEREVMEIEDDEEYIDISEGEMIEPQTYIRSIDVYMGDGVWITTKLSQGKKYYGSVNNDITDADEVVMDAYEEISKVLKLDTNMSGDVWFEFDRNYYVYDENGKYVGETTDTHKVSKTYYLASEKIDLSGSSDDGDDDGYMKAEDDDDDVYEDDDWGYVDDTSYGNFNDNPSTGVRAVVSIVAAMGLTSLAVVGVLLRKKKQ